MSHLGLTVYGRGYRHGVSKQPFWMNILALPVTSCETLCKSFRIPYASFSSSAKWGRTIGIYMVAVWIIREKEMSLGPLLQGEETAQGRFYWWSEKEVEK